MILPLDWREIYSPVNIINREALKKPYFIAPKCLYKDLREGTGQADSPGLFGLLKWGETHFGLLHKDVRGMFTVGCQVAS